MIGQLHGILLEKHPPQLILNVHGVGYEVDVPQNLFDRLPENGEEITLYTHFVVREDAHQLYGFDTRQERTLFRILLKVNGVGPRLGLSILSSMRADEFVHCVLHEEISSLTRLPGIGKKTAERLVIEIRDKLIDWQPISLPPTDFSLVKKSNHQQSAQDAIAALIALGYKSTEANRAIAKLSSLANSGLTSEEMIKHALREGIA